MRSPNVYAGSGLDRAHGRRRDPEWLQARRADPGSGFLILWNGQALSLTGPDPAPALLAGAEAAALTGLGEWAFLGERGGQALFALDLPFAEDPAAELGLEGSGRFADLRQTGPVMGREDAALVAYARALMLWHRRHRYCGLCGAATGVAEGGHQRRCTDAACAAVHFPRTDPAVIMLVTSGDRALLGRQRDWPTGRHSTLAGFVEPGESLEEAVAREVMEEVGVRVTDIRYHSSQPWPFPASVMLGFWARALDERIAIDPGEIESAGWFTRAELRASPEDERLMLPRRDSIAYRLIQDWIEEG